MSTNIDAAKCKIQSYQDTDGEIEMIFDVAHNNGTTTVSELLTITGHKDKWVASIDIGGTSEQSTPEDAALKIAEWMDRLAKSIRYGEFNKIHIVPTTQKQNQE